jgi:cellobiose transport system substrate-binding protein
MNFILDRRHLASAMLALGVAVGGTTFAFGQDATVSMWIRPNLFTPEQLAGIAQQFPNLKVEIQESPDVEPKLRAALRARSGIPDIVMLGGNVPDYYASEDMFVDLRDYGFNDVAANYLDWKVGLGTSTSGRVIAAPLDTGPYVFFYRADVMAELGFPSDPAAMGEKVATWEGYVEVASAAAKAGKFACDAASSVLTLGNNQKGFAYFQRQGDQVVPAVDTPELKENFIRAITFVNDGLCANVVPGSPEWSAAAAQGTLIGFTGPIYNQNGLKRAVTDSVGQWRVTATPGGLASAKGSFIAVTAASKHPAEAAQVVYWLTSAENQTITYRDVGPYPSTPASLTDAVFHAPDAFYGGQVLVEVLQPVLEGAPRVIVGPFGDNVSAIFRDTLTNLAAAGGGDAEATYSRAVQDAKSALGQ